MPVAVHAVVPVAVPVPPVKVFTQVTEASARLSDAVPARMIGVVFVMKVGRAVGDVIVTAGFVLSRVTAMDAVVVLPAESVALTLIVLRPEFSAIEGTFQFATVPPVPVKA